MHVYLSTGQDRAHWSKELARDPDTPECRVRLWSCPNVIGPVFALVGLDRARPDRVGLTGFRVP